MKKLHHLLVCSLMLNLALCVLASTFVYRRGGISYLMERAASYHQASAPSIEIEKSPKYIDSPWYLGRKSTHTKFPRKEAAIIFAGDSITNYGEWHELFQHPVLNRGIGGDTVEGLRSRIDEILQHHPHQLFVMIGINDLMSGKTSDEVLLQYQPLIHHIRTTSPHTQIFLQSILPVNAAARSIASGPVFPPHIAEAIVQVNKRLAEMADGKQIIYIDLYSKMVLSEQNQMDMQFTSDGIHLNGDGYVKWRDVVRPFLSFRFGARQEDKSGILMS